jgi:hypothetical protein
MKLFQARTGFFFLWNYGLWWLELPITRTHFDSPFEFEPQKFYCIYILIIYKCNLYLSIYTLVDNKRLKKHHGLLIFNVYLYPRTTDQLDFSLLKKWTVWLNVSPQKATNEKCKQMNKWGWKYKQINDRCCYLLTSNCPCLLNCLCCAKDSVLTLSAVYSECNHRPGQRLWDRYLHAMGGE